MTDRVTYELHHRPHAELAHDIRATPLDLRLEPIHPADVLTRLMSQRARIAKSQRITLDLPLATDVVARADVDLLARVLENVLDNAIRHTQPAGRIAGRITRRDDAVHIEIANTGPAIPVDLREHIFQKYGQASSRAGRKNLGLGLYFCRMVAEAHGGRLFVEETSEFPTVFILTLRRG